jgi:hypothetical protein
LSPKVLQSRRCEGRRIYVPHIYVISHPEWESVGKSAVGTKMLIDKTRFWTRRPVFLTIKRASCKLLNLFFYLIAHTVKLQNSATICWYRRESSLLRIEDNTVKAQSRFRWLAVLAPPSDRRFPFAGRLFQYQATKEEAAARPRPRRSLARPRKYSQTRSILRTGIEGAGAGAALSFPERDQRRHHA